MGVPNMKTIFFTEEELSDGIHTVKSALEVYRAILEGRIPFDAPQEIMTELRLDERRMTKLCMQLEGNWIRVPKDVNPTPQPYKLAHKPTAYEETCSACLGDGINRITHGTCNHCHGTGRRRVSR